MRTLHHSPLNQIRLDQLRLGPEAEALEEPVDGGVALVRLGVDPVDAVVLEEDPHHRGERLLRQPASLMLRSERDADLGAGRRVDAHRAITTQHAAPGVNRGQLHPLPGLAELDLLLRRQELLGVDHRERVSQDW
jgi:hypothetical protein